MVFSWVSHLLGRPGIGAVGIFEHPEQLSVNLPTKRPHPASNDFVNLLPTNLVLTVLTHRAWGQVAGANTGVAGDQA